jgi:hypothetical protein
MIGALMLGVLVAIAPPTPQQYYAQALATMQRLAQPAYVSLQTHLTVHGMAAAQPCDHGKIRWWFGFGPQMRSHELAWDAMYSSQNATEAIRTTDGQTCRGPAQTFDRPTWQDAYAWVRYGILSQGLSSNAQAAAANKAAPPLRTIADVSVVAPGAYSVTDGGAQRCPSGSAGHELHFAPRFDSAKHPLRDAVVETQSTRICMIRFDLGSYQAAGTGFRGDMQLNFGDVAGNWIITRGHAAMALRAVGLSLKSVVFDFWYTNVTFPATFPDV